MASYFDEHDCEPLGDNERPNDQLMMARLLLDSGIASALSISFESLATGAGLSGLSSLPPATSKRWLRDELPKHLFTEEERAGQQCPICLKEFSAHASSHEPIENSEVCKVTNEKRVAELPGCGHSFHCECLLRWLERTSSCPLCRQELPTDDERYEEFKKQSKRKKVREQDLAALHDSMFT